MSNEAVMANNGKKSCIKVALESLTLSSAMRQCLTFLQAMMIMMMLICSSRHKHCSTADTSVYLFRDIIQLSAMQ